MTTSTSDMMLPIILVGLTALLFGGLIGAVIASALRSGGSDSARPPSKNLTAALQIWRDRRNGRLLIGMDEELFKAASGLSSRQRSSAQMVLTELQDWLGTKPARPSQPASAAPQPVATGAGSAAAASVSAAPVQAPPQPVLKSAVETPVQPVLQPPTAAKKPEPPQSIVAQIDEILQEALPHTVLKNRKIRLVETPGRGMQVVVDGNAYEGVGDVPEPEVRLLIQKCVSRWEKKA